ncbi:MAG: type II toxin-antitoxin system prevent-host-death family antitoxin [Bacteroidetes bacterium]|nr:type II toxin-antitoxin system prevent-host-death family antitoxin [Bacteroidota bacterium]MCL5737914.1 type II toxin-antitoxin system prevent-host-death family antitoxin [Bacteroidota bacterium]
METKSKLIGSFNAKTHLSKLIDDVQKGEEYIITKRGKLVAKLIPYRNPDDNVKIDEIIAQFDKIRNSIKRRVNIKRYIAEGRKY